MKAFAALNVLALLLVSSLSHAQAIRPCADEKLVCKLEDSTNFYNRTTLDTSITPWSGLNDDEPSIEPNECKILTALANKDAAIYYTIILGDSDNVATILPRTMANPVQSLKGEVTFPVVANKAFYYRYGNDLLTCTLVK